ncbi:MAG: hypothetical protein RR235_08895, partial [Oscillospiraceae bacterium]
DEIEARKDSINAAYDALESEWNAITASLQEPARDISEILADIAKNGTPRMQAQVERIGALLGKLGDSLPGGGSSTETSGGTSEANNASAFIPGVGMVGISIKDGKTLTAGLPPGSVVYSADGNHAWEITGGESVSAGGGGYESKPLFDKGGVALGRGVIFKDTEEPELVLSPAETRERLAPVPLSRFRGGLAAKGISAGENGRNVNGRIDGGSLSDSHNVSSVKNYYISGVPIATGKAESMTLAQLADDLSVLSLYTERG